jgi:NTE family protein
MNRPSRPGPGSRGVSRATVRPGSHSSRFALVLGGGGARGLAHIGVLKVLEREGFMPDLIVGTSMGAIVGGMYAQEPNARLVEERMKNLLHSESFRKMGLDLLARQGKQPGRVTVATMYGRMKRGYGLLKSAWSLGLVEDSILLESLCRLLEDRKIQDCTIPFAAVACDLMSGEEVVFRKGSILKAVTASSAIPGVVSPVTVNGRLLVDGGPTSLIPVRATRDITTLPIVAVTVSRHLRDKRPMMNAIDILLRVGVIAEMKLTEFGLLSADVVVRPRVESYSWADFAPLDELITKGEMATMSVIRSIAAIADRSERNPGTTASRPGR